MNLNHRMNVNNHNEKINNNNRKKLFLFDLFELFKLFELFELFVALHISLKSNSIFLE